MDISIRDTSQDDAGLKAIPIVKDFLETLPALRPLLIVTKMLLKSKGLNSAAGGSLSSYAVTNICANYLQVCNA